ncbi:hypothetical protein, partial [Pantoea vagans]|uniref:hypothetical protein n=1 Tax=Pantoea vagans TaxID=470934 RepID=UPI00366A63C9
TTASRNSRENFGLLTELHLNQSGVQLLGCSSDWGFFFASDARYQPCTDIDYAPSPARLFR